MAHLLELLEPAGKFIAKRMFGGHGIFHDGLMFGLVADGIFYLKSDEENRADFDERELPAFSFDRKKSGKVTVTSYRQCPEEALDGPERMRPWALSAIAAAERHRKPPRNPATRRR